MKRKSANIPIDLCGNQSIFIYQVLTYHDGEFLTYQFVCYLN